MLDLYLAKDYIVGYIYVICNSQLWVNQIVPPNDTVAILMVQRTLLASVEK